MLLKKRMKRNLRRWKMRKRKMAKIKTMMTLMLMIKPSMIRNSRK